MGSMSILKEAAVLMGVSLVCYLLLLGLFVGLFRVIFPFKKVEVGAGARKVVAKFTRGALKEGRPRQEGHPRKIKLSNG